MGNQCVTALRRSLKELLLQVHPHLDVSEEPGDRAGYGRANPRQEAVGENHTSQKEGHEGAFVNHQGTKNWLGAFALEPKETKKTTHVRITEDLPFELLGHPRQDGLRSLQQIERPRTCSVRVDCGSRGYSCFGDSGLKKSQNQGVGEFFFLPLRKQKEKKPCLGNVAIFMLFVILCLFPVLFTWILG